MREHDDVELKNAVKIVIDAGFRVNHESGSREGTGIFALEDGYMLQEHYGSCHEQDFDTLYEWFMR